MERLYTQNRILLNSYFIRKAPLRVLSEPCQGISYFNWHQLIKYATHCFS